MTAAEAGGFIGSIVGMPHGVSSAFFHAAIEAAQVGVFVQQGGRISYANGFLRHVFLTGDAFAGRTVFDLLEAPHHDWLREQLLLADPERPAEGGEVLCRRDDGSAFPAQLFIRPVQLDGAPAIVGTILDVSQHKEAEQRIRELADFDALTGLPNRRLLHDRFGQLLAAAQRDGEEIALIFLDLDHFKRVNDSLGHSVGDQLLCQLARRLETVVRRGDTLARLGGDEFILALPGIHGPAAVDVARRLIDVCTHPFTVGGHDLAITPSLGISFFPQDGLDFETLLRNADAAMYKAKELGRNTFQFYSAEMNKATLERLLMESSLRRALQQQEFRLHYQPLISLQSGLIVGAEALIRWQHPDLGMIFPDRFIHVAEENGLINPIGDWVLCTACRQAQAWQAAGLPPISVAVNVAPVQFRQAGFVDMVAGALASSGLQASALELEVTERTVMHDADIHLGTLSALSRMGVELALDDFGTGYSSLAYLKRFPVGKLKIDRSFIGDLDTNPDDQAIASTVVSMGRSLRMTVLAEGVETPGQLALLRRMGCDMAQGYLFSRPVPADEMADLLARQPFVHF
ncbi:EAL domain-containing protein [Dechloromonas sp. ZS-1]|uniref:putative bifunctional diguanylate cyclase/phosphodiesterase n=1 Tax=Dechloromonas sp. ZS-1 TaxID=3138067 RepID=UPI0031FBF909